VVLQLGTLYQQLFKTYRHHHSVSAAISKLNFFAGHMVLIHGSMFVTARLQEWANIIIIIIYLPTVYNNE